MPAEPDPVPRPLDHLLEGGDDAAPALVLRGGVMTRGAARRQVARMAGWLASLGLSPGARVASWAAKGELTCLLPLAAARAGLVHVPVNPLLKRAQVAHILADSGAALLLASEARLHSLESGDVPSECGDLAEEQALASASSSTVELPPSAADPDALAALLYTSGSTGRPKGVMLSHANLWLGAVSVAHYLDLKPADVVLAVLPLSFDYGQNQLLSAWYAGASVVPLDFLTPRDVIKACARHRVTTLAAVPPLWVQLVEQEWPQEALASLARLTNSGGALGEQLVRKLRATFPQARLFPMYGLTEAFRSTFLDPELVDEHPTSMGRAIPFAEVLVMRDEVTLAEAGEEGELVHCGPLVAQGYWRDPQRSAERFRPAPPQSRYGGTAVWSGDRVVRDAEGLLHFVGRRDAMIKSAGNRISPQEIEEAALATGLVHEAVALGIPDERLGQAVLLVVRGSPAGEEALRAALKRELPNFMQPQVIRWVEAMPLGPNGKVDREALMRKDAPRGDGAMKPIGPIPAGFSAADGELAIGGHAASALVEQAGGTPLFVYSSAMIRDRVALLRAVLPERVRLHYAVKANPFPPLLALMRGLVDGFDIASAGELELAIAAGQAPAAMSFAGPGKRDVELELAILRGVTLNVESAREAQRVLRLTERIGTRARVAIRVNPSFELRGSGMKMGGGAKPFGVDEALVPALAREVIAAGAEWRGLHVFAGSQALDHEAIAETQGRVLDLAARLTAEIGAPLPHLNMGGGFGIPYFAGDQPLDVTHVGEALAERLAALPAELAKTELAVELGRYLVGEAGVYLSRIVDRKESHGATFLVTDGGLHHVLAASGNFGTVVRRNYPVAIASRFGAEPEEEASVVGCLCTPLDRLADQALLPRAEEGDLVAVFCTGAYGASASPSAFLGQGPAREMLV